MAPSAGPAKERNAPPTSDSAACAGCWAGTDCSAWVIGRARVGWTAWPDWSPDPEGPCSVLIGEDDGMNRAAAEIKGATTDATWASGDGDAADEAWVPGPDAGEPVPSE